MSGAKKQPQMEPVTVRFEPEVMRAIEQIAQDNFLSKAQVVRLATDDKLLRYLRDVKIISEQDAKAIRAEINVLSNETRMAEYELHKIGVNVNQIARALNAIAKNGQPWPEGMGSFSISEKDILDIIVRYEEASGKVGKALCRILG